MYSVRILRQAIQDITDLPKDYARIVSRHIDRLADNPRPPDAKKLRGTTDYSLRVGVYRILDDIDGATRTITVNRVKHRRDAYR
jgi:mRNA interferase RelE/StbE